jgi:hypothetical protein
VSSRRAAVALGLAVAWPGKTRCAPAAGGVAAAGCLANPTLDCLAELVFRLALTEAAAESRRFCGLCLARAGQFDLAERLAARMARQSAADELRRVIVQRRIAEAAAADPGGLADILPFQLLRIGGGPLATGRPDTPSPFAETALDILGEYRYGEPYLGRFDGTDWHPTRRNGIATVLAMVPLWRRHAASLASHYRLEEFCIIAEALARCGDPRAAAALLTELEGLAALLARRAPTPLIGAIGWDIVARGYMRLGRLPEALAAARASPMANGQLFADILQRQVEEAIAASRDAMPALRAAVTEMQASTYLFPPQRLRRLIGQAARLGHPDEARMLVRAVANHVRADGAEPPILLALAAASHDIGDSATARALLLECEAMATASGDSEFFFAQAAATAWSIEEGEAFRRLRERSGADYSFRIWWLIASHDAIPKDSMSFARTAAIDLPGSEHLMLYGVIARRLAALGRNGEVADLLTYALDEAEATGQETHYPPFDDAAKAAFQAGHDQLAMRALGMGIRVAAGRDGAAGNLANALVCWRERK